MDKEKIARINFLARKAKAEGLSAAEKEEQAALRAEYLTEFHAGLRAQLEHTYIERPDGTREKLREKQADGEG